MLENNINQNCKDKSLKEKLNFYKNSNYKMDRDFANRYAQEDFTPKIRAVFLAKKYIRTFYVLIKI